MSTPREKLDVTPDDVAAKVNNLICSFDTPIVDGAKVTAVKMNSPEGVNVYKRSLLLMLVVTLKRKNLKLQVDHALGGGYVCTLKDLEASDELVASINEEMKAVCAADLKICSVNVPLISAIQHFEAEGYQCTADMLKGVNLSTVLCTVCEDGLNKSMVVQHSAPVASTGVLKQFEVSKYGSRVLLRYPIPGETATIPEFVDRPIITKEYETRGSWQAKLGMSTVTQLAKGVRAGHTCKIVQLTEALHDAQIVKIASRIVESPDLQLILIAGPSSSGKTTFSLRLEVQLKTLGVLPSVISVDSYYKPWMDLVPMEDGKYDWEDINALNLVQLNENIATLLKGETAMIPEYDMKTSTPVPEDHWTPMTLAKGGVIIMEGIHCLNPDLTAAIAPEKKFRICISPLSPLRLDDFTVMGCTKLRLLRRMVRDYLNRGRSAQATLSQWPSVVKGEVVWIYPNQEQADIVMNSGNVYEASVLKGFSELLLQEIPQSSEEYNLAQQLLQLLVYVPNMGSGAVPPQSLLREFIGGSWYYDHAGWPKSAPY